MKMLIFLGLFFAPVLGFAQTGSLFSYEGVLTDTFGTPINTANSVTFQILYGGSCVTFEEVQTVTPGSNGEFSVIIGAGSRTDTTGNTPAKIFGSSGTLNCQGGGTQSLSGFATRQLHIKIGSTDLSPDVVIGNVPFSWNAQKLADKSATDFIQVSAATGVTQNNLDSIFNRYTNLDAILNGDFTGIPTTGVTNITNASVAAGAAIDRTKLAAGTINHVLINSGTGVMTSEPQLAISRGGTGSNMVPADGQLLIGNGTGYTVANITAGSGITVTNSSGGISIAATGGSTGTVTSITAGTGLTGGTITTTGTIGLGAELTGLNSLATTGLVQRTGTGTYSTLSSPTNAELGFLSGATSNVQTQITGKVAKSGDTMTGALTLNARNEVRFADADSDHYVGLRAPDTVNANQIFNLPAADGTNGQFLKTDGTGNLSWGTAAGTSPDASYSTKGLVQFDTSLANSGINISGGVASVNTGTGAGQIVKLSVAGTLPALSGSALTNIDVAQVASNTGKYFSYAPGGTACAVGEVLKKGAAGWECGVDIGLGGGDASSLRGINISGVAPGTGAFLQYTGGSWTPFAFPVCAANYALQADISGNIFCAAISGLNDGAIAVNALSRNRLSAGSPYRIIANDASGNLTELNFLTTERVLVSDLAGMPSPSSVTNTELSYISGVTGAVQTQLNNKLSKTGDEMTGSLMMKSQNQVKFGDSGSNYVAFRAPATVASNLVFTWPSTSGTAGNVLKTDGLGNLSWAADDTGTAAVDASYAVKGLVQFDSNLATSGISVTSGVAKVNKTTTAEANKILELNSGGNALVNGVVLNNGASLPVTIKSSASASNSYTLTLPQAGPVSTGQVLTFNASGVAQWDTLLTSVGSTQIQDGSIVDADINGTAAIGRAKLANGTANHVLINNASGVMSSEAELAVTRGGTGANSFTANGLVMSGATNTSALAAVTCASLGRVLEWTGTTWGCSGDFVTSGNPGIKVNYVMLTGGPSASGVTVSAAGSSTNVDLNLVSKGTLSAVRVGSPLVVDYETVSKTFRTLASVPAAGTNINFANGNLQYTTSSCGAFNLLGMLDGATYVFAVKGTTSATCSFTNPDGLVIKLPPDHGPTEGGKSTLYTFMVMGTDVYVSWVTGY